MSNETYERGQITPRDGGGQERAPDVDAGELILNLRLREQTLSIGHFDDAGEPGIVAGSRLCLALLRRRELDGRIGRDRARRLQQRRSGLLLVGDRQESFVVERGARPLGCGRRRFPCTKGREIEHVRKQDLDAGCPVRPIEAEAIDAAVKDAVRIGAAAAREHAGLDEDAWEIGPRKDVFERTRLVDGSLTHLRERVCARRCWRDIGGWKLRQQLIAGDRDAAGRDAQHTAQRRPRDRQRLLGLTQTRLGRRPFRLRAR